MCIRDRCVAEVHARLPVGHWAGGLLGFASEEDFAVDSWRDCASPILCGDLPVKSDVSEPSNETPAPAGSGVLGGEATDTDAHGPPTERSPVTLQHVAVAVATVVHRAARQRILRGRR